MTTAEAVQELHQALKIRCDALEGLLSSLRGNLGKTWASLQDIIELIKPLPGEVASSAESELSQNADPDSNLQYISILLRHLNYVIDFVEKHLSHGTRPELSDSLAEEIRNELTALGLVDWSISMSHGGPDNFLTTHGDLASDVYGPLAAAGSAARPAHNVALFKVPRIEGSGVLWRPVLLGHEAAHVAIRAHQALATFDLAAKFDFVVAGTIPNPQASANDPASLSAGLYAIAESWAVELLCDAQAMRRFGPSSICALAEYLTCIDSVGTPSLTHPPRHLRIKLLQQQLGAVADARLETMLKPWTDATPATLSFNEPWADHLATMFLNNASHIPTTVSGLPGSTYDWAGRVSQIHQVADDLIAGLPADVAHDDGQGHQVVDPADVVSAAWIARREGADSPYDKLAQKSLVDIQFVRKWVNAGGVLPTSVSVGSGSADESPSAMLSAAEVAARIASTSTDQRLEIRPLLHEPAGSGVDLRLGSRFIVFRRRGIAAFDPLADDLDPRAVQQAVELAPGETLILHPNEIVLGATMEYLSLPPDLSAQVITRSSYGRLGLLTATAVQVHAGFRGCLTLELVNLSTIPITLTEGERIAQLVLWRSTPSASKPGKYSCPTGPEFSKVRDDPEADVLRKVRA
ncbi:MAG: dCTP deaminase [Marmoricola sp.]|nr:dCTP deaminase [Marmoricola sp.]